MVSRVSPKLTHSIFINTGQGCFWMCFCILIPFLFLSLKQQTGLVTVAENQTWTARREAWTFPKFMVLEESTTQTKCQVYFLSVIKNYSTWVISICQSISQSPLCFRWHHEFMLATQRCQVSSPLQMAQQHITGKLDAHLHCWKGSRILLCIFTHINFRIWRQAAKTRDSYYSIQPLHY